MTVIVSVGIAVTLTVIVSVLQEAEGKGVFVTYTVLACLSQENS